MPRPHLNFTVTILISFTLVFMMGLGLAVLGFRGASERAAIQTAEASLAQVAATVSARTSALVDPVLTLLRHAVTGGLRPITTLTPDAVNPLLAMLAAEPELRAVSVAWPDGTLLQIAPIEAVARTPAPAIPDNAAHVARLSRPGGDLAEWLFLDTAGHPAGRTSHGPIDDPRTQTWYLQALEPGLHISTLYRLGLSRLPGLSASGRQADGAVISFDITLASLGAFLWSQQLSPHSLAFLFNDLGILLAHPDDTRAVGVTDNGRVSWVTLRSAGDPRLRAVWEAHASAQLAAGEGKLLTIDNIPTLARLERIESLTNPPVLVAVTAPRSDFTQAVEDAVERGTLLALGAFLFGLVAIALVAWRIAHPLGVLMREAQSIRRLELAAPVALRSHITEVERLAEAVAAMKATLNSFSVYLPRDLVRQYLAAGTEPRLGGERVALSLMFTDVQNFTTIGEHLDPMDLTRIASTYFEAVTGELLDCGATIDKYIGDSVMAFWNAPRRDARHAQHACLAALRTRNATLRLAGEFTARGWPALRTRFGVHTGEAVVGNVGSSDRMTFTAMGSMVNLANRLEGLNKVYGTQILVSESTRIAAGARFVFRPADIVVVKGTVSPLHTHELLGLADPSAPGELRPSDADLASLDAWTACVTAFREGRFGDARDALAEARRFACFPLAEVYAERLAKLGRRAEAEWAPTVKMTEK